MTEDAPNRGGRPSTYQPGFCESVIALGAQGKSPTQISTAIGIPRTTMRTWAETHEEFSEAMQWAKTLEQAWWEDTAMKNLNATRFQAVAWVRSMCARFREDYTERRELNGTTTFVVIPMSETEALL